MRGPGTSPPCPAGAPGVEFAPVPFPSKLDLIRRVASICRMGVIITIKLFEVSAPLTVISPCCRMNLNNSKSLKGFGQKPSNTGNRPALGDTLARTNHFGVGNVKIETQKND